MQRRATPDRPQRASPLAHLAGDLAATGGPHLARLRELPFLSQVELRLEGGDPAAALGGRAGEFLGCCLPPCGTAHGDGRRYVLWRAPGWYMAVDELGTAAGLEPWLRQALGGNFGEVLGTVADVSAERAVLELSGPRARDHRRRFAPPRSRCRTVADDHSQGGGRVRLSHPPPWLSSGSGTCRTSRRGASNGGRTGLIGASASHTRRRARSPAFRKQAD